MKVKLFGQRVLEHSVPQRSDNTISSVLSAPKKSADKSLLKWDDRKLFFQG